MSENKGPKGPMMGPGRGAVIEKPKNFSLTLIKLIKYAKNYVPAILIALIFSLVSTLLQILGPNKLREMTDIILLGLPRIVDGVQVSQGIDMDAVGRVGFILIIFYSVSLILGFAQNFIMSTVTQRISRKMRSDISSKINKLPLQYFDNTSHGDVLSRVTNDVDTVGQTLGQSVGNLVTAFAMFFGSIVMMFYNSWILALTAIVSGIAGILLMAFIMSKTQTYFKKQQEDLGAINGHIEEMYSGHNVVQVYNYSEKSKNVFEEINTKLYDSAWKSQFLSGLMMPMMGFIGNFGYVAVCVVGATLAMNGIISFGVIVAFTIYIRLFTQPLSQFAQSFNNLQRTAASGERVFELLEESELSNEEDKPSLLEDIRGDVDFVNVKFGYTPEKTVINNFSASIKAGQKVAIVGPTGAGKTTIVNLLMRFYEIENGDILIDGKSIREVPRENVRDQFSMVLQDTWIFEGSIRENIVYNKENVSDEEVIEVSKAVGIDHFIKTLPKGYETILSDKDSLSAGQKQLITIARAMIHGAPLTILDEATSSVDTRTERMVQIAMDKLTKGRTSFVIAHRLSTIKNADLILVMADGDIVESGNHEDLLAKGSYYFDLYNSQFEAV
ncbi:ABC transporter ATP-binding protein [Microaceticoccus formicicus]|uniref:ABC transporter ATP-binding protein n=1 Tax=Microaceticoccus formicicus TaxID=3118105 RepID=UPI003CD03C1A|nr:ABC transporter ATP-binding protein [Peptoniphilaceae bacterium AMB_02]